MSHSLNRSTFAILFFIVRSKRNKKDEVPIYCRLTINGQTKEFSTQIWIAEMQWDVQAGKVKGNKELARSANTMIEGIRNSLQNVRANLLSQGKNVTAEAVINQYSGKGEKNHTVIEIHSYFNEHYVKRLIGKDYAEGTYKRYVTSLSHLKGFLKAQYNINDIALNDLTYSFISNYEAYFKTVRQCANNSAVKYVKNLRAVINYAIKQDWLKHDPFVRYKGKLDRVEKEYLTHEELLNIQNKELSNQRIAQVRDVFVFCCYTGLAYSDVAKLSTEHIVTGINGVKQIVIKRTKTDNIANIPLLDKAKHYLDQYADHPECLNSGKLLPVRSNQKQNAYLKEIADLCGINKNLTTHTARHTFATLMLTKRVSMESVSRMLGHTNIVTTQVYAKIVAEKLTHEMKAVNELLIDSATDNVRKLG